MVSTLHKIKLHLRNSISKKREYKIEKKGNIRKLNIGYNKYPLVSFYYYCNKLEYEEMHVLSNNHNNL